MKQIPRKLEINFW